MYFPPLLILTVPFAVEFASIPFPLAAPEEFFRIAPLFRMMSSVEAVASPTLNPGTAVLPLGNVSVIAFAPVGVIVSLTIDVVTAPVGKVTVKLPTAVELSITTESVLAGAPPPVQPLQLVAVAQSPSPPLPVHVHCANGTGGLNVRALLLAKIVEYQRSEIRGRRSVPVACAGGLIHAGSLNHDKDMLRTGREDKNSFSFVSPAMLRTLTPALSQGERELLPIEAARVRAMNGKAQRAKSKAQRVKRMLNLTRPEQRSGVRGRRSVRPCRSTLPRIPSPSGRGSG